MSVNVDVAAPAGRVREASHWERIAPLSGVAFFVLLMVAAVAVGKTPAEYASGASVISDFAADAGAVKVASLLEALGVVSLVLFASRLRSWLQAAGADALASAAFGGAIILAVGGAARAGIGWALASADGRLAPDSAQTLYVLFTTHYPAIVGIAVFMFAAAGAILRTGALPMWLGWIALPIGIAAVAPPSVFPLIAAGLWSAAAGVVMYLGDGQAARAV